MHHYVMHQLRTKTKLQMRLAAFGRAHHPMFRFSSSLHAVTSRARASLFIPSEIPNCCSIPTMVGGCDFWSSRAHMFSRVGVNSGILRNQFMVARNHRRTWSLLGVEPFVHGHGISFSASLIIKSSSNAAWKCSTLSTSYVIGTHKGNAGRLSDDCIQRMLLE